MVIFSDGSRKNIDYALVSSIVEEAMCKSGYEDGFDDLKQKFVLRSIARASRKRGDIAYTDLVRFVRDTFVECGFTDVANKLNIAMYTLPDVFSICPDHGILFAEQAKCPKCGKETKIFRAANDVKIGKEILPDEEGSDAGSSEYIPDQIYDIMEEGEHKDEDVQEEDTAETIQEVLFFTRKIVAGNDDIKEALYSKNIKFKQYVFENQYSVQAFSDHHIESAPTLLVKYADQREERLTGVSAIMEYLNSLPAMKRKGQ